MPTSKQSRLTGAPTPREDSSIEPAAFRASFWNSSSSPPFPLSPSPRPVQLSPGLSPSLRSALPQPKALRPPSQPTQSDLSVASTRAELEPTALRDLRRVTAPPALMDPWAYDYQTPPRPPPYPVQSPAVPGHRPRFAKSVSATSLLTDRMSDVRAIRRDRWSVLTEVQRERERQKNKKPNLASAWRNAFRKWAPERDRLHDDFDIDDDDDEDDDDHYGEYDAPLRAGAFRLHRYGPHARFDRLGARGGIDGGAARRVPIPDRLHDDDSPLGVIGEKPTFGNGVQLDSSDKDPADSVLSALTRDSDERQRPRAISESGALNRRSSFVAGRDKVLGIWDRIFRRGSRRSTRPPDRSHASIYGQGGDMSGLRRSGKLTRLRSGDRLSTRGATRV